MMATNEETAPDVAVVPVPLAPEDVEDDDSEDDGGSGGGGGAVVVVDDYSLQSRGMRFRGAGVAAGRIVRIYDRAAGGQLILEHDDDGGEDEDEDEEEDDDGGGDGGAVVEDGGDNASKEEGGGRSKKTKKKRRKKKNKKGENRVLIKTTSDDGYAFALLRSSYTLMSVFVAGFLFIAAFCVLLFLFIDLATSLGASSSSSEKGQVLDFVATLLSVPVFVYSMSMAMTLATRFVIDTFQGHPLIHGFGFGRVTTDWIAFTFYLGIPLVAFVVTLFARFGNWWQVSLLTWFVSILAFMALFALCELWFEAWACLELVDEEEGGSEDGAAGRDGPWMARAAHWSRVACRACVRTCSYRLSGTHVEFKKMDEKNAVTDLSNTFFGLVGRASQGPYSCLANRGWCPCCTTREGRERVRDLDEVLGNASYVTRGSWSLERLFCRSTYSTSVIPVTRGESSITEAQINSNIACGVLGNLIIILLCSAVLVWLDLTSAALTVAIILIIACSCCVGLSTYRLVGIRDDIVNEESATLYRYYELYQHSVPVEGFTWTIIGLEVVFFFLLPLIQLAARRNVQSATLFAFLGLFSAVRHYLNPRVLLLRGDSKDYFKDSIDVRTREDSERWKAKSRLYHVVAVNGDKARKFWASLFVVFTILFILLVVMATSYSEDTNQASNNVVTLAPGYPYHPQPTLAYPTCRLKKGLGGLDIALADFAFMAKLAYTTDTNAQNYLSEWFGPGVAMNDVEAISEFKSWSQYNYTFGSSVAYKLVTFPKDGKSAEAILTIRGTQNVIDWLANFQLWLPASFFQLLRFALPFSELFTPIIDQTVAIVSRLETESITKVSYYRETSGFVNYLKSIKGLQQVQVTGHSLGGGLAIITGAQTNTSAVGISGPNAKLSRHSFYPELSMKDLNELVFNVIPARDPVAMIDDVARLYQNVNCTAASNQLVACHSISRTLCEILYTCGSGERPVLCECVFDYGYPEPLSASPTTAEDATNQFSAQATFAEVCVDKCSESYSEEKCSQWRDMATKSST